MPINICDYSWSQTVDTVAISLNLNHASQKDVDIIYTSSYLKVSYSPYIFEVFLTHKIIPDESYALLLGEKIEFTLQKSSKCQWESLSQVLEKEDAKKFRSLAIKDYENQERNKDKQKKDNRISRDRYSVSQQLHIDDEMREIRNNIIQADKEEFFSKSLPKQDDGLAMLEFRRRHSSACSEDGMQRTVSEADYDGDGEDSLYYSSTENIPKLNDKNNANRKQRKTASNRTCYSKDKKCNSSDALPPIRTIGSIKVNFTPRVFPTPSRESTVMQESEILLSSQNKPNDETSQNLDFFKNKAISLFGNSDYEGCINAFNEAIRLSPAQASFYSNRAAAHLALKKYSAALNDCTKALELLTPPSAENKKSRILCHIRRGTALVELHKFHQGYSEYEAALRLDPENTALVKDAEIIRQKLIATTTTTETEETGDSEEESRQELTPVKILPKI